MVYRTFNGWKQRGRVVMSGERSEFKNEYGDAMFHRSQTCLRNGIEAIVVYRDPRGRFVKQTTTVRI